MQELCFRRFARCFAYLRGGQARTHAGGREHADDGVHLQVRLAAGGGEAESGLEIGGWTAPARSVMRERWEIFGQK